MFLYLFWQVFSECLRFGVFGGNSAVTSNIASIPPFLLLQVFPLRTCCTFCGCPAVLGDSLLLFVRLFSLFSLCFSVWELLLSYLQAQRTFSWLCPVQRPSRPFFVSVTLVLISHTSFLFLCRISIFLLTLPICSCLSSAFPIKALSTFI